MPLLDVSRLRVTLQTQHGPADALREVSFALDAAAVREAQQQWQQAGIRAVPAVVEAGTSSRGRRRRRCSRGR